MFGTTCFQTVRMAPTATKMGQMLVIKDNNTNSKEQMEQDLLQETIKGWIVTNFKEERDKDVCNTMRKNYLVYDIVSPNL